MFGNLGMSEILLILVIALIIFGSRKLPQLGRTLGNSLAQFRRASEDFKRTWEAEATVVEKQWNPPTPSLPTASSQPEAGSESKDAPGSDSQKASA